MSWLGCSGNSSLGHGMFPIELDYTHMKYPFDPKFSIGIDWCVNNLHEHNNQENLFWFNNLLWIILVAWRILNRHIFNWTLVFDNYDEPDKMILRTSSWRLIQKARPETKLYIPSTINIWKKLLSTAIWADKNGLISGRIACISSKNLRAETM